MVNHAASAGSKPSRRGNMLRRKLLRDMRRNAMQFIAIILLCWLGTWIFAGLDGTWRMMDLSVETYFADHNLADFWVNASSFSQLDLARLGHLDGVENIQARTSLDFDAVGLGDDTSLRVHAADGEMIINTPLVLDGSMMNPSDLRGCMMDDAFARANNLSVGDTISLDMMGENRSFVIRALVKSPEHIVTAKDITPDPEHYGYLLISSKSVSHLPFTEVLVDLTDDADAAQVEAAISELLPSALIVTQKTMASVERIRSDVVLFRNMSYLFPMMAFAVSAMIVLTTLSRMIENQRTQMGTLKALGYRDGQIRRHYLSYALWPSLIGAFSGVVIGQYTLPYVLWNMEAANFNFPWQKQAPISLLAWMVACLSVALSIFICLKTYNKAAKETTASLLRPKPPKAGNRIFLERITPLWRRFSFNTKMIIRNLMRNKSRTAMALLGMLCCNMLIICTLGLQESISFTTKQYYGGTLSYDLRADLDATLGGTLESYQARLDAQRVEGLMEQSISLRSEAETRTTLLTILPEDQTLILLGKDQALLPMPEDSGIISRKLATAMDIAIGDRVEVWLPGDTQPVYITIDQYADTNFGQGLYIGRKLWESFHKGSFKPTALIIHQPTELCRHRLNEMDEITAIKEPALQYEQTMTLMESTTGAFSIMSAAALGLAFIICYNMGLMNFTERTRDYATLKVLGYHQKEIRKLMLRENDLTALLGVALGIPPGLALTTVILKSVETDASAFAAYVSPHSILTASVITFVFTWCIQWFLTRKVRTIDMVEALKSVE